MRRIGRWLFAGTLALGGLGGTALAGGHAEAGQAGSKMTLDQLPDAARSTFEQEAKGGTIEELRSEKRGGKTIFAGEVVNNGKGTELQVSEDGTLLKRGKTHDEATEKEHQK